jgi:Family of unknown function (DUF6152)
MSIRLRAIAVTFGVWLMASPTLAHHSMGTYDQSTMITMKGTVSRIEWRNPHAWITLTVNNADGTTGTQRIEIGFKPSLPKTSRADGTNLFQSRQIKARSSSPPITMSTCVLYSTG